MIDVRPARETDLPFVFATWLKSFKRESQFASRIRHSIFFPRHHKIIEEILDREGASLSVATPAGEPDVILGYLCAEKAGGRDTVHFAFVKPPFRRMGIAKRLLEDAGISPERCFFTHWTESVDRMAVRTRWPDAEYCPYLW